MSLKQTSSALFVTLLGAGLVLGAAQAAASTSETEPPTAGDTNAMPKPDDVQVGFDKLDTDKSKALTTTEAAKDDALKAEFKRFDVDHNMLLSLNEYRSFVANRNAKDVESDEEEEEAE